MSNYFGLNEVLDRGQSIGTPLPRIPDVPGGVPGRNPKSSAWGRFLESRSGAPYVSPAGFYNVPNGRLASSQTSGNGISTQQRAYYQPEPPQAKSAENTPLPQPPKTETAPPAENKNTDATKPEQPAISLNYGDMPTAPRLYGQPMDRRQDITMPDAPKSRYRSTEERLSEVTGGRVPSTMGGLLAALSMSNMIQGDDIYGDNYDKSTWKSQLGALPQYNNSNINADTQYSNQIDMQNNRALEGHKGALDAIRLQDQRENTLAEVRLKNMAMSNDPAQRELADRAGGKESSAERQRQNKILGLWNQMANAQTPEQKQELAQLIEILESGGTPDYVKPVEGKEAKNYWFKKDEPEVKAVEGGWRNRPALN